MSIVLRQETPADIPAIYHLTCAAFGRNAEAELVDRLRHAGDHALSLVAEENGNIVGHILFTPLQAPFKALALAPISVASAHQKQGIGSRLIDHSHIWAREKGYDALFVLGDPAYYGRFGYDVALAQGYDCPYAGEYFMIKPLHSPLPTSGSIRFAPAFSEIE